MSEKHTKVNSAGDNGRDWDPYNVWQKHIKEAETKPAKDDQNPTGSWRTDAVWQNLIKG
ncbi:MAG: hypothetical protein OEQ74_07280 [Gammaproteobacteria bacterium]|nr:hypothetical protein [Gammaproteobacteria bacterium]